MDEKRRRLWVIAIVFSGMAFTVPVYFYVIADGALMPYAGIAILFLAHAVEAPVVALLEAIHLAVYGVVLFFMARMCAERICPPGAGICRQAAFIVGGVIVAIGFLPIFSGFHWLYENLNAYQFYPMMFEKLLQ